MLIMRFHLTLTYLLIKGVYNMNRNPLPSFDQLVETISGDLAKTTIGMNSVFDGLRTALGTYDSYPPFNFEQLDDTHFRVTFALAGFTKNELTVSVKENWLTIEGDKVEEKEDEDSTKFFHHKGIANRSFKRVVQLASDIVVKGATMENGLLVIDLEKVIPDEKKPQTIKIK